MDGGYLRTQKPAAACLCDGSRTVQAIFGACGAFPKGYWGRGRRTLRRVSLGAGDLSDAAGRLLDAGATLNYDFLLPLAALRSKQIHCLTLAPESDWVWHRGPSYVNQATASTSPCHARAAASSAWMTLAPHTQCSAPTRVVHTTSTGTERPGAGKVQGERCRHRTLGLSFELQAEPAVADVKNARRFVADLRRQTAADLFTLPTCEPAGRPVPLTTTCGARSTRDAGDTRFTR